VLTHRARAVCALVNTHFERWNVINPKICSFCMTITSIQILSRVMVEVCTRCFLFIKGYTNCCKLSRNCISSHFFSVFCLFYFRLVQRVLKWVFYARKFSTQKPKIWTKFSINLFSNFIFYILKYSMKLSFVIYTQDQGVHGENKVVLGIFMHCIIYPIYPSKYCNLTNTILISPLKLKTCHIHLKLFMLL